MSFQSTFTHNRGFHIASGFSQRLFIVLMSFHMMPILMMMLLIPEVAAPPLWCPPACDENPDHYCVSTFMNFQCRRCEVTCGNAYHLEECNQHCKGSQYFPGRVTTPGLQLATPSSSSASLSVPTSVGTVDPEEQFSSTRSVDTSGMSLEVSPTTDNIVYITQIITTSFPPWMISLGLCLFIILFWGICFWHCISDSRRSQGNAVEKHQDAVEMKEVANNKQPLFSSDLERVTYQTARPEENFPIQESVAQGNQEEATNHSASNSTAKPEVPNNSYSPNRDPEGKDAKLAIPEDSSCANKNTPIDKSGDE